MSQAWDSDGRLLRAHAAFVGLALFLAPLVALVALTSSVAVADIDNSWSNELRGAIVIPALAGFLPLAWPFEMAAGLYELGLADRVERGDARGRRAASRLLFVQAGYWTAWAAGVASLAMMLRGTNGSDHLRLAWVPLAALAIGHAALARRFQH